MKIKTVVNIKEEGCKNHLDIIGQVRPEKRQTEENAKKYKVMHWAGKQMQENT